VLVSGSIGTFFYQNASDSLLGSLRARLMYSAALLARPLDARELAGIRTAADATSPAYRTLLATLRDFKSASPDIAFIYVMRREGDRVVFVADSDTTAEQAQPGEVYDAVIPELFAGFSRVSADEAITHDRWGYFLSGYAPLRHGGGAYLVGIDMRADEVARKFFRLRATGIASLFLAVVLAWVFAALLAARITRPVRQLAEEAGQIAEGRLGRQVDVRSGDEIEELAFAFNAMSGRLQTTDERRNSAIHALEDARQHLEVRVAERTETLESVNAELREEVEVRKRAEAALAEMARTDSLTGLLNRRAILELLEREAERVRRGGPPFALAMADLDNFKRINDTYGHDVGDEALVHVARRLEKTVRAQDVIARWGGEELLIFLPATSLEGALLATEKVRRAVAEGPHTVGGQELPLTMSLGVASTGPGTSLRTCIQQADAALYRAKAEGRNRVERAPEAHAETSATGEA
jgi:diguanylate cyclase (GGDEF)-like protein